MLRGALDMLRRRSRVALVAIAASVTACASAPTPVDVDLGNDARGRGAAPNVVEVEPSALPSDAGPAAPIAFEPWNDALRARALGAKRPIFLVVCAAWAAQCTALERDVLSSPDVEKMARAYVAARLDVTDATPEIDAELARLEVKGMSVPTMLLLDERDGSRRAVAPTSTHEELARALDEFARRP